MDDTIRVELPLRSPSKVLREYKTMGDLRKAYPKLVFHKYIYLDPADNKLKGVNPPDNLPIVENAYITFVGPYEEVIKFTTAASRE
ncbi:hypothetical protein HYV85_00160 [Candidatus Woesearchaeota archaeon]|nr:hypothetical protein [Candidatus Woesearchaeota archaeon]